jgi:hypothetical protein
MIVAFLRQNGYYSEHAAVGALVAGSRRSPAAAA